MLIAANSLSQTLDAINAAHFFHQKLPATDRRAAASFILSRFDQPRAYAHTFALFPAETSLRLFTGERATNASARHIAAEEACRALIFLNVPQAQTALQQASENLQKCIGPIAWTSRPVGHNKTVNAFLGGTYCCAPCSVGLWRHLTAGGLDHPEPRLARGLKCLRARRRPDHTWQSFPFWYTLSALLEMPIDLARKELHHAAPKLEKPATRQSQDPFTQRRIEIANRVLALL